MQLSLRTAVALELELERFADDIPTGPIDVSVYETDVPGAVAQGRAEILRDLEVSERADAVLYALKAAIERTNITSGAAEVLSERARLESRRRRLESLAAERPARMAHLSGCLVAARTPLGQYRTDEIAADVLSEDDLSKVERDLTDVRRQLRDLASTLADLQGRVTLDVAEAHVVWLKEQGMV
jgi:hypothetical protein